MAKKQKNRWGTIIAVLVILFIVGYIFAGIISLALGEFDAGNVAVIKVNGVILTQDSVNLFSDEIASSEVIVEDIKIANEDPSVKAILIEINSPGGAPVATDEISRALQESNKPTVAWIREVGASGAYWIASSTDYVVANRMSIVGSVGVMGSYLDFSGLIADYNVTYERFTGGKYKDLGSPFRSLKDEERKLFQKKIDLIHQEFKDAIQENRGLTNSQIEVIGTGEFYLGREALDLEMIDKLGGKTEAISYIENQINESAMLVEYEHEEGFFEMLSKVISKNGFKLGQSSSITLT